jgi:hypothetical protein
MAAAFSNLARRGDVLTFRSEGVPVPLANALRRALVADVEGSALSDATEVARNDGELPTPLLLPRLLQLPLLAGDAAEAPWSCHVVAGGAAPLLVTAAAMGLPVAPGHRDIPVTVLPPGGVLAVAGAVVTRGGDPRFAAVCAGSGYEYERDADPQRAAAAFAAWRAEKGTQETLARLGVTEHDRVRAVFDAGPAKRLWRTGADGEPAALTWTVDSVGVVPPAAAVARALVLLHQRFAQYAGRMPIGVTAARLGKGVGAAFTLPAETATLAVPLQAEVWKRGGASFVGWRQLRAGAPGVVLEVALTSGAADADAAWAVVGGPAAALAAAVDHAAKAWHHAVQDSG